MLNPVFKEYRQITMFNSPCRDFRCICTGMWLRVGDSFFRGDLFRYKDILTVNCVNRESPPDEVFEDEPILFTDDESAHFERRNIFTIPLSEAWFNPSLISYLSPERPEVNYAS